MAKFRHHPGHPLADEKGWVELNDDYWKCLPDMDSCGRPYSRSDGPSHNVISDIMSDTKHMGNGKTYDSKSEFRKATKASGCIEVGNDFNNAPPRKNIELDRRQRREHIKQSIYELKNGKRY